MPPPQAQSARLAARTAKGWKRRRRRMPAESRRRPFVRLEGLVEQRRDRGAVGVAYRAAGFLVAFKCDQGRLRAHVERLHSVLLAVEIDHEIHEILEFRRRHQLTQDRVLRLAGRTPGGVYADEDRL